MTVWTETVQQLLSFFSDFLSFLKNAGVLESYSYSTILPLTVLESEKEEAFLSRFILFLESLKEILECSKVLKLTAKPPDANVISYESEIVDDVYWASDKLEKNEETGFCSEDKRESQWAESDSHSNDEAEEAGDKNYNVMIPPDEISSNKTQEIDVKDEIKAADSQKIKFECVDGEGYHCPACDKLFTNKSAIVRHYRTHTGEHPFPCEHCPKTFATKSGLESHLLRQHNTNTEAALSCSVCGKLFMRRSSLNVHLRIHSSHKPFSCSVCGKMFTQKVTLDVHLAHHTGSYENGCDKCSKRFATKAKLNEHMKQHETPKYSCSECGRKFVRQDSLHTHLRTHNGERPYGCSDCGKAFQTKSNLTLHKQTHSEEPSFTCQHCGSKFKHKISLSRHVRKHLQQKLVTCPIEGCRRTENGFLTKRSLNEHIRNYHQRFLCANCGQDFGSRQSLAQHEKSHDPDLITETVKYHACHLCPKRFAQKSKLNAHVRIHLQEPQFQCNICGKRFHRKDVQINHTFLHSGQRPFSCAHCGKAFALKSNLSAHLMTHAGNPQHSPAEFACRECGKKFRHQSSLKLHRKAHLGQYSHSCATCGKQFLKKSHYEGHLRSHDSERPFQCRTCGKGYKERKHCREHARRMHPNEFNLETLFASITSEDAQVAEMLCAETVEDPAPSSFLFPPPAVMDPILQHIAQPVEYLSVTENDIQLASATASQTLAVLSGDDTTSVLSQSLET